MATCDSSMVTSSRRVPNSSTSEIHGNAATSSRRSSARRVNSRSLTSPCTAMRIISSRKSLRFTRGGSISRGSAVTASTRFFTSFRNWSRSTSGQVLTSSRARPSEAVDDTRLTLSRSSRDSSMRNTICSSTSCGAAPGQLTSISTWCTSKRGKASRSMLTKPSTPASRMPSISRLAATGLCTHQPMKLRTYPFSGSAIAASAMPCTGLRIAETITCSPARRPRPTTTRVALRDSTSTSRVAKRPSSSST